MRPQFLGLGWDCHLQYLWNVMRMTAEMEGDRNASDRLDRKEMPQNPVREYEPQKLTWTHLCCSHWRSNWPYVINHSTFAHFPPTNICMLTTNLKITCFQLHYLQILECNLIFKTEDFWRCVSDLKEIVPTKMKMLSQFTPPHAVPNLYDFLILVENRTWFLFEEYSCLSGWGLVPSSPQKYYKSIIKVIHSTCALFQVCWSYTIVFMRNTQKLLLDKTTPQWEVDCYNWP